MINLFIMKNNILFLMNYGIIKPDITHDDTYETPLIPVIVSGSNNCYIRLATVNIFSHAICFLQQTHS